MEYKDRLMKKKGNEKWKGIRGEMRIRKRTEKGNRENLRSGVGEERE